MIVLISSMQTSVGVVFFGIALALVFAIPTGIIEATTGISVEFKYAAFLFPVFLLPYV